MKIEKLSENQIKLTLTKSELLERNIKLDDLTQSVEKTTEIFRDIIEKAFAECGFKVENAPLMVEAMPLPVEGTMVIIVTRLESDDIDNKFNMTRQSKYLSGFEYPKEKFMQSKKRDFNSDESNIIIYSFNNIDDIISVALRIKRNFDGLSSLYKYDNKYFMVLQNIDTEKSKFLVVGDIMCEYGQKHISTKLSKYFLIEHGECIVENRAIDILCSNYIF